MALRDVALGDGEEARQARLRGQQVVEGAVRSPRPAGVGQAIADREELAPAVVEEGEVHPVRQGRGAAGDVGEARGQLRARRLAPELPAALRQSEERPREVAAVDGGHVARAGAARGSGCRTSSAGALRGARAPRSWSASGRACSTSASAVQQAEIVRRERGEQAQADVGRRGPVGHRWASGPPGSCRAAASGPRGRPGSRSRARSCAPPRIRRSRSSGESSRRRGAVDRLSQ